MSLYADTINDNYGRPVVGAQVYVYDLDGSLADLTLSAMPIFNPVITDDLGAFEFEAPDSVKDMAVVVLGATRYKERIIIGNPGADLLLRQELAADTGSSLVKFKSPHLVGAAPAYIRSLGEKVGEVIGLIDLAGKPAGDDYTDWFEAKIQDYPFKKIKLQPGIIKLAGAGVSGVSNITLEGDGDSQTVLLCPSATLDLLEVNEGNFWRINNVGVQHSPGATAGRGIVFTGASSSNWLWEIFGALNPEGLIHFIGDAYGVGSQSGNRVADVISADNGGKMVYFKWSHDWGLSGIENGRVTGAMGYADAGIYIEQSDQGAIEGLTKIWDCKNALYMKECNGNRIDPSVRFEMSREENIVLDATQRTSVHAQTHTPNMAAGTTGTHSAVLLKNASQHNSILCPNIYSWDPTNYLMKHCVELDATSVDNIIGDYHHEDYTVSAIGGAGATGSVNFKLSPTALA